MQDDDRNPEARGRGFPRMLLALALLALLLVGIGLYTWMSGPDEPAPAADDPAATAPEPPPRDPAPAASEPKPEPEPDTGMESGTAAPAGTGEATGAETDAPSDTASRSKTDDTSDTASGPGSRTSTESAPEPRTITVKPGDTLWAIARRHLGDPYWWPIIYAENRPELAARNPDLIQPGRSLRIPELPGRPARTTEAALEKKADAYRIVADDYQALGHFRAAEYQGFIKGRL